MAYIIGQILGIISSICCFIGPFFKKKWMMLINTIVANALVALNFLLMGKFGSVIFMQIVAVIQAFVSLYHVKKCTKVTLIEQAIFFVLYMALGITGMVTAPNFVPGLSMANVIETMPLVGSVFFLISVFMRDEQKSRLFSLFNAVIYLVYMGIVGSTTILSQIFSIVTTISAMYKYRNTKGRND